MKFFLLFSVLILIFTASISAKDIGVYNDISLEYSISEPDAVIATDSSIDYFDMSSADLTQRPSNKVEKFKFVAILAVYFPDKGFRHTASGYLADSKYNIPNAILLC